MYCNWMWVCYSIHAREGAQTKPRQINTDRKRKNKQNTY